jgi:hypothetical protein
MTTVAAMFFFFLFLLLVVVVVVVAKSFGEQSANAQVELGGDGGAGLVQVELAAEPGLAERLGGGGGFGEEECESPGVGEPEGEAGMAQGRVEDVGGAAGVTEGGNGLVEALAALEGRCGAEEIADRVEQDRVVAQRRGAGCAF